jgi:hypothetical protein
MGSKVVTIEPDRSEWNFVFAEQRLVNAPIQVIFTWSKVKLESHKRTQTVTNCLMRIGLDPIGFGWTVENPNDEPDRMEGIHWSFKRAINSMLHRIEFATGNNFSETFKKRIDKAFRRALWEAMNK